MVESEQLFAHQRAGAVQAAADGADAHSEYLGDGSVIEVIDFPEHQHATEFFAQSVQCQADLLCPFGPQYLFGGRVGGVDQLGARSAGRLVDRDFRACAAAAVEGLVECDAVEPGVE